jgi:hypothetical protein
MLLQLAIAALWRIQTLSLSAEQEQVNRSRHFDAKMTACIPQKNLIL